MRQSEKTPKGLLVAKRRKMWWNCKSSFFENRKKLLTERTKKWTWWTMPWSYFHVKLFLKRRRKVIWQNGVAWHAWGRMATRGRYGVYVGNVAITGYKCGCYGMYVSTFQKAPRRPRNCHKVATSHSISQNVFLAWLLRGSSYSFTWRRDRGIKIVDN